MCDSRGYIVRSTAGRDKKRVFLIVGEKDGRVLVADGTLHTLSRPKEKNLRHLAVLAAGGDGAISVLSEGDGAVAEFLSDFETQAPERYRPVTRKR